MKIIVIGGSIVGLGTALALADQGHDVEILERNADTPPKTVEAAAGWRRPTVPQAVHSHAFASLGCNLLRQRANDVYRGLLEAGGEEINIADYAPPTLSGFRRTPEDAQLRMVTTRRSTFELVLRERTLRRPRVRLRTGATVRGLLVAPTGFHRVTGVRLASGEACHADLVVDATGRRSAIGGWLADAALPQPRMTTESCRIAYYTRYYRLRSSTPPGPLNRGFGAGGLWDSYTAVLFRGDNDTFSISLGVLPDDSAMKSLRHPDAFTAAIEATPLLAGWVDPANAEPISEVYAMGSLDNALRLPAPEQPPVSGLLAVGDSVCTTNPAYGRGVSLGLRHAFLLADLLSEHPTVDAEQATEFTTRTRELVTPWFHEAMANDRGRATLWEATVRGQIPPRPPEGVVTFGTAVAASTLDEEVWRRVANVMMMLRPPSSLYGDEEIRDRVGRTLTQGSPPQLPGASRERLLDAVAGSSPAAAGRPAS